MSGPVATVLFSVWWEEDPTKTRDVTAWCKVCYPQGDPGHEVWLVSPQGKAHEASLGDETDCGHDCTGPEWWWRV